MSKQLQLDDEVFNLSVGKLGKIKSRTSSYAELAMFVKDKTAPSDPIPPEQKKKESVDIDKAFPKIGPQETIILLRSKWTKGTNKETQEQEFLDLIHQVRPDLNRKEAGTLFAKLVEDGLLTYDDQGWLVWVK